MTVFNRLTVFPSATSDQTRHRSSELVDPIDQFSSQLTQISAELRLLNGKKSSFGAPPRNPWLGLQDAAALLRFKSARALKNRIKRGQFPPDCWRQIPTPSGKRHTYLIHVERYLKQLN
jgi:hypothetical protein